MKISIIDFHKENVTMNAHSPEETAAILGVTTRTLAAWRKADTGPEFAKVGNAIRYPEEGLIDWLSANITLPGSPLTRARTAQTLNDLRGIPVERDPASRWACWVVGSAINRKRLQRDDQRRAAAGHDSGHRANRHVLGRVEVLLDRGVVCNKCAPGWR